MELSYNMLAAAASLAPTKETRYMLNGVHVEPCSQGSILVSTDGSKMFAGLSESTTPADFPPITIPIITVKTALKAHKTEFKSRASDTPITLKKLAIFPLAVPSYQLCDNCFEPIDGPFPEWRRVIPSETSGEAGFFNAQFLAQAEKALAAAAGLSSPDRGAHSVLRQNGLGAAVYESRKVDAFVVVMPLRDECEHGPVIFSWIEQERNEQAA